MSCLIGFVNINAIVAEVGQHALDALEVNAAIALHLLAEVHVREVIGVGVARAAYDAMIVERGGNDGILLRAELDRLAVLVGGLQNHVIVVDVQVALVTHGRLEALRALDEIPRIGQRGLFRIERGARVGRRMTLQLALIALKDELLDALGLRIGLVSHLMMVIVGLETLLLDGGRRC